MGSGLASSTSLIVSNLELYIMCLSKDDLRDDQICSGNRPVCVPQKQDNMVGKGVLLISTVNLNARSKSIPQKVVQ